MRIWKGNKTRQSEADSPLTLHLHQWSSESTLMLLMPDPTCVRYARISTPGTARSPFPIFPRSFSPSLTLVRITLTALRRPGRSPPPPNAFTVELDPRRFAFPAEHPSSSLPRERLSCRSLHSQPLIWDQRVGSNAMRSLHPSERRVRRVRPLLQVF